MQVTHDVTRASPPPERTPLKGRLATFDSLTKDTDWSFLADNEYIATGYRHRLSCCDAIKSLFTWHNEVVNVWTHMAGAIFFLFLLAHLVLVLSHTYVVAAVPGHVVPPYCAVSMNDNSVAFLGGLHSSEMLRTVLLGGRALEPFDSFCSVQLHSEHPVLATQYGLVEALRRLRAAQSDWRALATDVVDTAVHTMRSQHERALASLQLAQRSIEEALHLASGVGESMREKVGADGALQALSDARSRLIRAAENLAARTPLLMLEAPSWRDLSRRGLDALGNVRRQLGGMARDAARLNSGRAPTATEVAGTVAVWPFAVFIISAAICLSLSAAFHLCHPVSQRWFHMLAKLDYTGIAVLIAGSTVPMTYLEFYCMPHWAVIHLVVMGVVSLGCVYLSLSERFASREYRIVRMSAYIAVRSSCKSLIVGSTDIYYPCPLTLPADWIFWRRSACTRRMLRHPAFYRGLCRHCSHGRALH